MWCQTICLPVARRRNSRLLRFQIMSRHLENPCLSLVAAVLFCAVCYSHGQQYVQQPQGTVLVQNVSPPRRPVYYLWVRRPQCNACQPQQSYYGAIDVLQGMPYCSTFVELLQSTQMTSIYEEIAAQFGGAVTIFAPSNMGFASIPIASNRFISGFQSQRELLKSMLMYHAVPGRITTQSLQPGTFLDTCQGGKVYIPVNNCVNGGQIITSDKEFSMGYIHVVNSVMYPVANGGLWDTISSCPTFSIFRSWCQRLGVSDWFIEGPYTVFLPADEAFSSLSWTANQTLMTNYDVMKETLMGHVVPGIYYSTNVNNGQVLTTLGGTNVPCGVQTLSSQVYVSEIDDSSRVMNSFGTANIVIPDIPCNNGVIHVIDTVQYYPPTCIASFY